jgi:PTH1 family peptidyl-tRNA hydrolase
MKLIVGLGNPGKDYEKTRHNIGFSFIDYLANKRSLSFNEKFESLYTDFLGKSGEKIIFIKPQTYMNASGRAVSEVVKFFKISTDDIFVSFDDLDMQEGSWKIQKSKYPKCHNGVDDIIEKLSSDHFHFIRIGIDDRTPELRKLISGRDYVLQKTSFDYSDVFQSIENELIKKEIL